MSSPSPLRPLVAGLAPSSVEAARRAGAEATPKQLCCLAVDALDAGRVEDARALLARAAAKLAAGLHHLPHSWDRALRLTMTVYGVER